MKFLRCSLLVLAGLSVISSAHSQVGNGLGTGRYGTFNTYSAYSIEPGYLSVYNQGRVYAVAGLSGFTNAKAINLFHASNNMTVAFGVVDHVDALISIITYQDLNQRSQVNKFSTVPGDLFGIIRAGGFEFMDGKVVMGTSIGTRIPTGGARNVPFEVYKSESFELGASGLLSFYGNPYYKEQGYMINVNVGGWYHNDKSKKVGIASNTKSDKLSVHVNYGLGFAYPVQKLRLSLDAYGLAYVSQPVAQVYSRESFAYIAPGLNYQVLPWLSIGAYFDLLVAGSSDETAYDTDIRRPGQQAGGTGGAPNYAKWRLGTSLSMNILPVSFYSGAADQKRRRLLERLLEEERGAQRASYQLEKMKQLRVNAEKELEKIRKELEAGKSGN